MTDGEALLRAVLLAPADDVPRLVYADWLEENGQSDRAAFIRLQLAAPGRVVTFGRKKVAAGRWQWGVTRFGVPAFFRWERLATAIARTALPPDLGTVKSAWRHVRVTLTRGFMSGLEVPANVWAQHGPVLVLQQPIEVLKAAPMLDARPDLLAWAKEAAGLLPPTGSGESP